MSHRSATRLFLSLAVLACLAWGGAAHAVSFGHVQTTIQPADAVLAGAQWRVDGDAWQNSGVTVEVYGTNHTVSFLPVPGWRTPAAQAVVVPNLATITTTGTYLSYNLCEGVGACNRSWVSDAVFGGNPWFVQEPVNRDGHNALQSGAVAPGQVSRVATTVEGPCTLSFWWKASCNTEQAEFYFYVNDTYVTLIKGETDWTQRTHELGAGSHLIEWFFLRAAADPGGGMNCGWLDQFLVTEAVPPTGSVVVNGGAARTNTPDVLLGLTYADAGAGVTGMRFSNNGSTWSAWQKPAATKAWALTPGDGVKAVRAQFRDKAGNVSDRYTDTILLDQTPPDGAIVINNGGPTTDTLDVVLHLFWVDHGSGVSRMRFSSNGYTWSAWEPVASTKPWTLPGWGYHTLRAQYLDRAGNASPVFRWTTKAVE